MTERIQDRLESSMPPNKTNESQNTIASPDYSKMHSAEEVRAKEYATIDAREKLEATNQLQTNLDQLNPESPISTSWAPQVNNSGTSVISPEWTNWHKNLSTPVIRPNNQVNNNQKNPTQKPMSTNIGNTNTVEAVKRNEDTIRKDILAKIGSTTIILWEKELWIDLKNVTLDKDWPNYILKSTDFRFNRIKTPLIISPEGKFLATSIQIDTGIIRTVLEKYNVEHNGNKLKLTRT
jgi:hypothetical protein